MMWLPNIQYPPDTVSHCQPYSSILMLTFIAKPWKAPQRAIQRYVRQYASSKGLNLNDDEHGNVTSYSTASNVSIRTRVRKNGLSHYGNWWKFPTLVGSFVRTGGQKSSTLLWSPHILNPILPGFRQFPACRTGRTHTQRR